MNNRVFDPEKYGMVICPCCYGHGFIQNPERQCCPKCGGFGYIVMEAEQDANSSTKDKIMSPSVIKAPT